MRLTLLGLAADQALLGHLATQISELGHDTLFKIFSNTSWKWDSNLYTESDETTILYCWTSASVGMEGKEFQENAINCKSMGCYHGLIFDDIAVPIAVQDMNNFRLPRVATFDADKAVRELVRELETKLDSEACKATYRSSFFRQLLNDSILLVMTNIRLILAVGISFLLATIGLLADGFSLWEQARKQPTADQQQIWQRIELGDSCDDFENYIHRFGLNAPFANEARYRIDQAQSVSIGSEPESIMIPFSIPYGATPIADLERVKADLIARANAEAEKACRPSLASLGDSGEKPRIFSMEEPVCEALQQARYICRAQAVAECIVAKPVLRRLCNKSHPKSVEGNR